MLFDESGKQKKRKILGESFLSVPLSYESFYFILRTTFRKVTQITFGSFIVYLCNLYCSYCIISMYVTQIWSIWLIVFIFQHQKFSDYTKRILYFIIIFLLDNHYKLLERGKLNLLYHIYKCNSNFQHKTDSFSLFFNIWNFRTIKNRKYYFFFFNLANVTIFCGGEIKFIASYLCM